MIAYGGIINCYGKFHSININMGEYLLDCPIITMKMGGINVILGVQWLQLLGKMAINFQYFFMRFSFEGKEIEIRGIQGKISKEIRSNSMKKLLKKRHHGVIAQLCSLDVPTYIAFAPMDLQKVMKNHSKVFGEMPKSLPPTQYHAHDINL
jgi:hypothetical protein